MEVDHTGHLWLTIMLQPRQARSHAGNRKSGIMTSRNVTGLSGKERFEPDLPKVKKDAPRFEGTDVPLAYLFFYQDDVHNVQAFLRDYPEVSKEQALSAIVERARADLPIESVQGLVSGAPVFKETRVMAEMLFGYFLSGYDMEDFLIDYPGVTKEQVEKLLLLARDLVEAAAYENSP